MYPLALALTMLVEVPVYVLAVTVAVPVRRWRVLAVAVAGNLLTHPVLWWVLSGTSGPGTFAVAEALACLVEGALLAVVLRLRWPVALAAAVAANAASALVGVLVLG